MEKKDKEIDVCLKAASWLLLSFFKTPLINGGFSSLASGGVDSPSEVSMFGVSKQVHFLITTLISENGNTFSINII